MSKITSYFTLHLPSSKETNIGEAATKEANKQVKRVLEEEEEKGWSMKEKKGI